MANKQKHWCYVLVMAPNGPAFVTSEGPGRMAMWEKHKKPLEFSEKYAEGMVYGLNLNGFGAYLVKSQWELDRQPYRYEFGKFVWEDNNDGK